MYVDLSDINIHGASIPYITVEQYNNIHKDGYGIYRKWKSTRRLSRFIQLIKSFEKSGWIDEYQLTNIDFMWWLYSNPGKKDIDSNVNHDHILLAKDYSIVNGKHRIALAKWHNIQSLPCIITDIATATEDRSMFTVQECKKIDSSYERMCRR